MTVAPQRPAVPGLVGTAHTRVEGRDKVTGAARYGGDVPFAGLAHGMLVLSTVAVADPVGRHRPGARHAGRPHRPPPRQRHPPEHRLHRHAGHPAGPDRRRVPARPRAARRPVALVVAETPEQARAAADALTVTYEAEPHDVAPADRPDAYPADGHMPGTTEKGDLEAELAASAHVVDAEYTTPEEHHAMMEPHVATAWWDGGRSTWSTPTRASPGSPTNWPGCSPRAVRGAGPLRARRRRIRQQGRPRAAGGRRDGRRRTGPPGAGVPDPAPDVLRHRLPQPHRAACPPGRYLTDACAPWSTPRSTRPPRSTSSSSRARAWPARCTTPPPTAPRTASYGWTCLPDLDAGARRGPGSFALECALDELAEKCGLDPIELRLRNEPETGPVSGLPFAGRNVAACFREGARRFGWDARDARPGVRRDGRWLIGTGTAAASFPAGTLPSTAAVTAEADGTFTVRISASDIGTGARTALTLIAADALAVPSERVRVHLGDSDFGPSGIAAGSMGTRSWGWAVAAAAEELRERLLPGVELPPEGITVRSDTTGDRRARGQGAAHLGRPVRRGRRRRHHGRGAGAADARRLRRRTHRQPLTARNQLVGGMTWGISMALHEEAVRDPASGALYGADLACYHVATHADVPRTSRPSGSTTTTPTTRSASGHRRGRHRGRGGRRRQRGVTPRRVRHRGLPIRPDRVLRAGGADA